MFTGRTISSCPIGKATSARSSPRSVLVRSILAVAVLLVVVLSTTSAARAEGAAPSRAPVTATAFPMISLAQQISAQGRRQFRTPPDTSIAVGPAAVVEMVNSTMTVWDKASGAQRGSGVIDLAGLFGVASGWSYGDPRVTYDAPTGRWFASIHAVAPEAQSPRTSEVRLAVSASADPLGAWNPYVVAEARDGILYDQPRLGLTDDKVLLAWDNVRFLDDRFEGAQWAAVDKAGVVSGAPTATVALGPVDRAAFAIVPAVNRTGGSDGFMVWSDADPDFLPPGAPTELVLLRVTGSPNAGTVAVAEQRLPMRATVTPPTVDDAGSDPPGGASDEDRIDGGDERLLQAEWRAGRLWTSASSGCLPPGDTQLRVCSRLVQLDTSVPSLLQDFDVSRVGGDVFFPSVTFNGLGDALFGFSTSTPRGFVGVAAAAQLSSDRNLVRGLTTVRAGEVAYAGWACFPPAPTGQRWGDYSGAAPDPSSPLHGWIAGEYAARAPAGSPTRTPDGDCNWATAAGRLSFPAPSVAAATNVRGGQTVTLTGTDFSLDTTVRVDGVDVGVVAVVDSTTLRFTAPAHSPGLARLTVTTPYGTSAPFDLRYPDGYWLAASDGGIFSFGDVGFLGSTGNVALNKPIVTIASTRTGNGYWLAASDGGIFAFGDARFLGSTGNIRLNSPVVAMVRTPSGNGYWLVASDGGIFSFGDAGFFGSTGNIVLNKPIVAMAATTSGAGYWLTASDGGIFAFGDAAFLGSTGNIALNKPIVAMARTVTGAGYWLTASDGGIFAFGDAPFVGSTGNVALNKPIVAMTATADGTGYWLTASDGGIFAFGGAPFLGSTGNIALNRPIVAMASLPATASR